MWEQTLVTTADVPAGALWLVTTDVPNWSCWQPGLDQVRFATNGHTILARQYGRPVRLTVEESRRPSRVVIAVSLFFARMRTVYEFSTSAGNTQIRVAVQLFGPLAFVYTRSLSKQLDLGLSTQTHLLIDRARRYANPGNGFTPLTDSSIFDLSRYDTVPNRTLSGFGPEDVHH